MKMKSIITKVTVTAMLLTMVSGQCFAASAPFTDIGSLAERDKVISLQAQGIINGTGDDRFLPGGPLTSAQGIRLLVKAFDLNIDNLRFIKEPKASDYFKNAKDDAWYSQSLIIISYSGLELPADLDPDAVWTREEFTGYLIQLMEKQGGLPMIKLIPVEIKDGDKIDILKSGLIQRALTYNVAALDQDGNFRPKETITRAEAAIELYHAREYLKAHPAPAVTNE